MLNNLRKTKSLLPLFQIRLAIVVSPPPLVFYLICLSFFASLQFGYWGFDLLPKNLEAGQKSLIKPFRLQTKEYTEKGRILRNAFSNLRFDLRTKKRILESPSKV